MKGLEEYVSKLHALVDKQKIYKLEAYGFVMAALHNTADRLPEKRHLSGPELLDGIRLYALEQYGPLVRLVFEYWGVRTTLDFGKIVFALIDAGFMSKTAEDSLADFKDVYSFAEAFGRPVEWAFDE